MAQHDFILLDRSGSMQSRWAEAISSVNSYVWKLAEDKVDTGVTLITFDRDSGINKFEVIRDKIAPGEWMGVSADEISPRGGTPLNDAMARMISLARTGGYDKVVLLTMTDGQENSSIEMTTMQIKTMLDECRAKNW